MKKHSLPRFFLLLTLCAGGLSSCETAQHRMEREIAAAIPAFHVQARYQAYLSNHGANARKIREAATRASSMRLHITSFYPKEESAILPLSAAEARDVRALLAQIEETPCWDYQTWLEKTYADAVTGPWPSAPLCQSTLEFVSSDGKVRHTFDGYDDTIGDTAHAKAYQTDRYKPAFMLPSAALERWNKQPFLQRSKRKLDEFYTKHTS